MKFILLINITFIWQALLAQHNSSLMPNTINIKIVKPIPPAKPIDYSQEVSKITNSLNDVAAKRAAQRKAFDDMTLKAIMDIKSNTQLGYSTTINNLVNNVQEKSINNIKTYYNSLTTGQIDPEDYTSLLNYEGGNYYNFSVLISQTNELLKRTIDKLNNENNLSVIEQLSAGINNYCENIKVKCAYSYSQKSKRYNQYYGLQIELRRDEKVIAMSDFYSKIQSILQETSTYCKAKVNEEIRINVDTNKPKYEIDIDINVFDEYKFTDAKINIPTSFKKKEGNNEWTKKYSDGTMLDFKVIYLENTLEVTGRNSKDFYDVWKETGDLSLNFIPRLGIAVDSNSNIINDVYINSSAYLSNIKKGDKIISIDNVKFSGDTCLRYALKGKKVNDTLSFVIERNSNSLTIPVKLINQEDIIAGFEVQVDGNTGFLVANIKEFEEYGDIMYKIDVNIFVPIKESSIILSYSITPSNELLKIGYKESFKLFKPLIKSINDSVSFYK
jgi:hypothetical protein